MSDYLIGLTGGVASGKSALEREFLARGIFVADADRIARDIVEPGQPVLQAVVKEFGQSVLGADGHLDRAALRRRIFSDHDAKRALEAILHPVIRDRLREDCLGATGPYAVAMVPLLAEGGRMRYPWLDRILVVDAPIAVRKRRLMQRDGIDEPLAQRMLDAQATREQRLAIADDVVVNDGDLSDLAPVMDELDARYRALAAL
ncbi:MAG TPA: dephospho-CoA kinase [Pseudoxanthomonas sp.]|nr:dephospho-CoA kinase [Pseudoxanthomonas sp.]